MDDIRYGIYLRPDAATSWAVTQITDAVKRQFGVVSAAAFPPHATLIGNLKTKATEAELITALDSVFTAVSAFPVFNSGVYEDAGRFGFDINCDESGQTPNAALHIVYDRVAAAIAPLSVPHEDYLATPVDAYVFSAHMGLASHDLEVDTRMSAEIGEFIAELPITAPRSFTARWYSLYETRSNWEGQWWHNLRWRNLKSWRAS